MQYNLQDFYNRMKGVIDLTKPWVIIHFYHEEKEYLFYSCVNSLSGSRLTSLNLTAPYIDDEISWVKETVKNIFKKGKIIAYKCHEKMKKNCLTE